MLILAITNDANAMVNTLRSWQQASLSSGRANKSDVYIGYNGKPCAGTELEKLANVIEYPFKNFSHARNTLLDYVAMIRPNGYIIFIDDSYELVRRPLRLNTEHSKYAVTVIEELTGYVYKRTLIQRIENGRYEKYIGDYHECISPSSNNSGYIILDNYYREHEERRASYIINITDPYLKLTDMLRKRENPLNIINFIDNMDMCKLSCQNAEIVKLIRKGLEASKPL